MTRLLFNRLLIITKKHILFQGVVRNDGQAVSLAPCQLSKFLAFEIKYVTVYQVNQNYFAIFIHKSVDVGKLSCTKVVDIFNCRNYLAIFIHESANVEKIFNRN